MKIEIIEGRYQTKDGEAVTILATGLDSFCTIIGIVHDEKSGNKANGWHSFDELVKIPSLEDLKIDDKILVKDFSKNDWLKAHFFGINDSGRVMTFINGLTSWTNDFNSVVLWDEWKLPDSEV